MRKFFDIVRITKEDIENAEERLDNEIENPEEELEEKIENNQEWTYPLYNLQNALKST